MLDAGVEVAAPVVAKAIQSEAPRSAQEVVIAGQPEAAQAKEAQPKPTLWQEMRSTARVMVSQAINEVGQQIKDANGDQTKIDVLLTDPKNRALATIDQLRSLKTGDQVPIPTDQQVVIVDKDGWKNTVAGIANVDADSFQVIVTDENNKTPHLLAERVSKQALEQAHLLQKLMPQLGAFPESQGRIISLYLESVKSGKEPASLPENSEKMLLEAAQSAGILTTNDVELLIKRVLPPKEPGPDAIAADIAKVSEENERLDKKRARLLKPFSDRGIVVTEPQQINQLFEGLGVGATQLSEIRNQSAIEATRLNLLIKANENNIGKEIYLDGQKVTLTKELYRHWEENHVKSEEFSDACLSVIEVLKKDGPIKQYFDQLNAGTLSQEEGQLVVESFHNGQIAQPPDIKTAADEKSRIKLEKMNKIWKKQDILSKAGKGTLMGGGGILGLLALFGMLAKKET